MGRGILRLVHSLPQFPDQPTHIIDHVLLCRFLDFLHDTAAHDNPVTKPRYCQRCRCIADAEPDPDGQARVRALVQSGEIDLVTVAAPSAVDALLDALPPEHAGRLPLACIGPVTARAAKVAGFPVRVESTAATIEGGVQSIVKVCGA